MEGVKDNTAYELDNIDLGGFEIKTDNVTVTLLDGSILILGNKVSSHTLTHYVTLVILTDFAPCAWRADLLRHEGPGVEDAQEKVPLREEQRAGRCAGGRSDICARAGHFGQGEWSVLISHPCNTQTVLSRMSTGLLLWGRPHSLAIQTCVH